MNLPHELEKLRDELASAAEPSAGLGMRPLWYVKDFKAGFDACFQALSEAAGEFAHAEVYNYALNERGFSQVGAESFTRGARWMFEADRARIGGAIIEGRRMAAEAISSRELALEARLAESAERMDRELRYQIELQDSLAELQVKYDERGMAMRETGDMVRSLYEPKLSAAEARVKELEAKLKMAIEYLEPRLAGKSGSRGLTIVLPALREALKGTDGDD